MTGEELLKIYKPFFVEVCFKWVSAFMSPKMFVPEMSTAKMSIPMMSTMATCKTGLMSMPVSAISDPQYESY